MPVSKKESLNPSTMIELLLEEARLAAFDGEWVISLKLINTTMLMEPSPVTRLTLFQMRSLAYFELGDFRNALRDLDTLDSLGTTFTNALTVTYGKILRARIMARSVLGDRCELLLSGLWTSVKSRSGFSIDTLLTVLRAEIDVRRFCGLPHSDFALASWLVADAIGDKLYEALGRLDYFCSLSADGRRSMTSGIKYDASTFRRVNSLYAEMTGLSPATSLTAQAMNEFWKLENSSIDKNGIPSSNFSSIYFRDWVFILQPFKNSKALSIQTNLSGSAVFKKHSKSS